MTVATYKEKRQVVFRKRISRWAGVAIAACALALIVSVLPARAEGDSPVKLLLDSQVTWDHNVFRLPASAPDPMPFGIPGRSDRISKVTAGLLFDKSYAQQEFRAGYSRSYTRYETFNYLDVNASQYNGAWLWHLGPRISGTLSADHSEQPIPFIQTTSNQQLTQQNNRIFDDRAFSIDGWMFGGWHLLGRVFTSKLNTTSTFLATPPFESTGEEVGLRYESPSGNFISAVARYTSGTNNNGVVNTVNLIDSDFSTREAETRLGWKLTGKSDLTGRITYTERLNRHISQRNFSGTGGELRYNWNADGKWAVNFSATRTFLPWTQDLTVSYRIDDKISIEPSMRISERLTLRIPVYRFTSEYLGAVVPLTGPVRKDTIDSAGLLLVWTPPVRDLTLSATVHRDQRSSNLPGFDFNDIITMVQATLRF